MDPNAAQPIQPVNPVTQAPQIQQSSSFSKQTPKPKLSKWIYIGLIILLLIVVGSIVAYFLNKSFIVKPQIKQKITNTQATNLKTYKDTNYNFTFDYPSSLTIKKIQENELGAQFSIYDPKIGTESGTMFGIAVYYELFAYYLPEYISFDNLFASPSGSIINMYSEVFGNYQLIKNENTLIDGQKAFYYTRTPLPIDTKDPGTGKGIYIKLKKDLLIAVLESPEDKFENLNQVLATFKILK